MSAQATPVATSIATEIAAVIVYGPQGCGKSRHAQAIAAFFRKKQILDNWKLGDHLPSDALCLSSDERVQGLEHIHLPFHAHPSVVLEFADVAHDLKLD